MPTRNRGHLISGGIRSVVQQTFVDWELIVVDDGSTDNTKEVVTSFGDKRIKYFYQNHTERSAARNRGLDLAKGKYICFLDDDDDFLPMYLTAFSTYLESNNYPEIILRNGFFRKRKESALPAMNYNQAQHQNPVRFAIFNMCGIWSLCIPRNFLTLIRFPNHIYYWEDTYLILQLLMKHPFHQLDNYSYNYNIHEERTSIDFYKSPDFFSLVNNNTSAMVDFFDRFGGTAQDFIPPWSKNYILAEKYLDHAISSIPYRGKKDAFLLFKNSLKYPCFRLPILKKYLFWLIQMLRYSFHQPGKNA